VPQRFHHEELIVYQQAISFVATADDLLNSISEPAAAKDQLRRAADSVPANIAAGNTQGTPKELRHHLDIASGSTAECAACLDVLNRKQLIADIPLQNTKEILSQISRMLHGLRESKYNRIQEEPENYGYLAFSHEKLNAYQAALDAVTWAHQFSASSNLDSNSRNSLDRHTTSAVLNIAEGNAKRSGKDRAKFFSTAIPSALKAASALDVIIAKEKETPSDAAEGKDCLVPLVSLLYGLQTHSARID
jgi:four helix bundle protein